MVVKQRVFCLMVICFFVIPVNVLAADYSVSGAPDSNANGIYYENGTLTGVPKYTKANGYELRVDHIMSDLWIISDSTGNVHSTVGVVYWNLLPAPPPRCPPPQAGILVAAKMNPYPW